MKEKIDKTNIKEKLQKNEDMTNFKIFFLLFFAYFFV